MPALVTPARLVSALAHLVVEQGCPDDAELVHGALALGGRDRALWEEARGVARSAAPQQRSLVVVCEIVDRVLEALTPAVATPEAIG